MPSAGWGHRASKDASLLRHHPVERPAGFLRASWAVRAGGKAARRLRFAAVGAILLATAALAPPLAAQVETPQPDPLYPITVRAEAANRWTQGSYEVWLLRGNCRISQGPSWARCREAVLWIARNSRMEQGRTKVIAYLEGDVTVETQRDGARGQVADETWLGRFISAAGVDVQVGYDVGEPSQKPAIYQRGIARRRESFDPAVRRAQHTEPADEKAETEALAPATRRIRVFSRSEVPIQAQWFPNLETNQGIAVINSGVTVVVDGLRGFGSIDVSADRMVIWTVATQEPGLSGQALQDESTPLEIYMEGNVVFLQGEREIHAERMYYNVNLHTGTVLKAEILTPAPEFQGLLRLKAEILQQMGEGRFFAQDTFVTSSRLGKPGYRLQSGAVYFEDIQQPAVNPFTGSPRLDPETGQPVVDHQQLATSKNNLLFLDEVPVFYWPVMATDLSDPSYYIRRVRFKSDKTFGPQVLTDWDAYQLLGIRNRPAGTRWDLSLDYLQERGLGHGTTFTYRRDGFLGIAGPVSGLADYWAIKDSGDDLLAGRGWVAPEADYRFRLFWQHRQLLSGDYQLSAEVGWISDRNFLEQYYLREWNELKDETTGVELKKSHDNISWSVSGDCRVNDFFTQTDWLPRADHFWLGQPLLGDALSWFEHSHAAYARFNTTTVPTGPTDAALFRYLPWETSAVGGGPLGIRGERLATRQEIDWPLQMGPVKMVPYALGELAHWGADRSDDDLQRAYWQAGVRASLPIWKAYPDVESLQWNVHGVAHKVVFDAEFSFAGANRDMQALPLYDPLDDDSVEAFRRQFAVNTFGIPPGAVANIPLSFDERFYALRTGMAGWVTAPSTEVADDLTALRLGMRHRWQTKRGLPGQRRIVDWIVLDTNAVWFPDSDRDNFGEALGLVDYDFRWYVGDRFTVLSSGLFDFFPDGAQLITIGGYLQRPPRTSLYLGVHFFEGVVRSQVLIASISYRMSPKWVASCGTSVDLSGENIGQSVSITRIGESLLISGGVSVDALRGDDAGVFLTIEPRFLPKKRLGGPGGQIPVAGLRGLE